MDVYPSHNYQIYWIVFDEFKKICHCTQLTTKINFNNNKTKKIKIIVVLCLMAIDSILLTQSFIHYSEIKHKVT